MGLSRSRRIVAKLWLPALVLVVVVVTGFGIKALHGVFGAENRTLTPAAKFKIVQFNPKRITYEVFGDYGGWGRASYWNVDVRPVEVDLTALPWTHTEITVLTVATADIHAQVAGGNIGCRITVDGLVRSEHTATGDHAAVWCQVLSA
ncbi:MmpS family transport accessory protein [Mycobacteroides abscessus]|uniref:MmpS family transport accessory protein n=1 Tax=Mycobacteroides abscessus TaxID=36809 RepID=UPI00092C23DC|nr:MmpS family transport accessory protein [Mycobacteroides abscessus]SHQ39901.1 Putative membrane protein, MmpS family [Mycobacteroides abscessus subsp. abscessus]